MNDLYLVRTDNGKIGHADHLVFTLALENGELGNDVVVITKNFTNLQEVF
jgi:hypothetical protein